MRFIPIIIAILFATSVQAKDLYVDTDSIGDTCSDSTTWSANNISNPWCSIGHAWANAQTGDVVYYRTGTYNQPTPLNTTGFASNVTHTAYSSESVSWSGPDDTTFFVEVPGITVSNIHIDVGVHDADDGFFRFAWYSQGGDDFTLENCTATLVPTIGGNNGLISVRATGITGMVIRNNVITGTAFGSNANAAGLHFYATDDLLIENNTIEGLLNGIYLNKSPNPNTTGQVIVRNNVIRNCYRGIHTMGEHQLIDNNLFYGNSQDIKTGDHAGWDGSDYNTYTHNTFTNTQATGWEGSVYLNYPGIGYYNTLQDNIFMGELLIQPGGSTTHSHINLDYNLYRPDGNAFYEFSAHYSLSEWQAHVAANPSNYENDDANSVAGTPVFVGGSSPTTIAGFALASGSPGENAASDGTDMGADVSLVGADVTPTVVNGSCGANDGGTFSSLASGNSNNCETGSVSSFFGGSGSDYSWTCDGSGGGTDDDTCTATYQAPDSGDLECTDYDTSHPDWVWCDDFEDSDFTANYANYDITSISISETASFGGSSSLKFQYIADNVSPGHLWRSFGTNPAMTPQSDNGTTFDEIYWRFYVYLEPGWIGNSEKITRATMFTGSDWSQGMVAHLWGTADEDTVRSDPTSCVTGSTVDCSGYNDTGTMTWLGGVDGTTNYYDGSFNGQWVAVENYVKLNTPGSADGIHRVWINDVLEIDNTGLDFRGSYTAHGINAIALESWWNGGADATQAKYYDNFVISTSKIGLISSGPSGAMNPVKTAGVNPVKVSGVDPVKN